MKRRRTPLQVQVRALGDLVADARDELDDRAYAVFVAIALLIVAREAARLGIGELIRANRRTA